MSTFRVLPALVHGTSMRLGMTQEEIVNWDQIQSSWKQLKDRFAFQRARVTYDTRNRLDPIDAKMAKDGHCDMQPIEFRPNDRGKRSEFSLHIGC
jgi:hypothetical protein